MKRYFAYVRVSTARQGEGVSLIEQRSAIERYAKEHQLYVSQWFMEIETAAKLGRPVFRSLLRQIENRKADGLIIHKIDRSARNLRDWADLGELIDRGVDVRFAHDNLTLDTRGGRLAADIQAVIAADYIRNLREEVRKGIDGRLRQGLYPLRAPLGYLDRGSGRAKAIDPVRGPLIALAFELYATGAYTLATLSAELADQGLTNCLGRRITLNNLAHVLHNPFYAGTIRLRSTGVSYLGIHEPLISPALFEAVAEVLGRRRSRNIRRTHTFTYRGQLTCTGCGHHLIGERHKTHTYYRCHRETCRGICVREEAINIAIEREFGLGLVAVPPLKELDIQVAKKEVRVIYRPPLKAISCKKFDSRYGSNACPKQVESLHPKYGSDTMRITTQIRKL